MARKNQKNLDNIGYLGCDISRELRDSFCAEAKAQGYKIRILLENFTKWWLAADTETRQIFYHNPRTVKIIRRIVRRTATQSKKHAEHKTAKDSKAV